MSNAYKKWILVLFWECCSKFTSGIPSVLDKLSLALSPPSLSHGFLGPTGSFYNCFFEVYYKRELCNRSLLISLSRNEANN